MTEGVSYAALIRRYLHSAAIAEGYIQPRSIGRKKAPRMKGQGANSFFSLEFYRVFLEERLTAAQFS